MAETIGAPATAAEGANRVENRLVGRALNYWEGARGARPLPCAVDLDGPDCPFGADNTMVIQIGEAEDDDRVISAGALVAAALGLDPTGRGVTETLPSSTEMGLSFCRASVVLRKPMADVGRFFNRNGEEILYRSILLPLSEDGETVDRVVTAFSYKVVH